MGSIPIISTNFQSYRFAVRMKIVEKIGSRRTHAGKTRQCLSETALARFWVLIPPNGNCSVKTDGDSGRKSEHPLNEEGQMERTGKAPESETVCSSGG